MDHFDIYYTKNQPANNWSGFITAFYSNIPIQYLNDFRTRFPGKYKIRYRGPRNTYADQFRFGTSRQTTCLKQNAKTFSAYSY